MRRPTRAAILAPVKLAGRVVGVVQVMSDHVTYTDDQLALVDALVGQMAAASATRSCTGGRRTSSRRARGPRSARCTSSARRARSDGRSTARTWPTCCSRRRSPRAAPRRWRSGSSTRTARRSSSSRRGRRRSSACPSRSGPVLGAQALDGGDPLWFEREEDFDRAYPGQRGGPAPHAGGASPPCRSSSTAARPASSRSGSRSPRVRGALARGAGRARRAVLAGARARHRAGRAASPGGREEADRGRGEREQAARVLAAMGDGVALVDEAGSCGSGTRPPSGSPASRPTRSSAGRSRRRFRAGTPCASTWTRPPARRDGADRGRRPRALALRRRGREP